MNDKKLRVLKVFLLIYGALSLVLFSALIASFIFQAPALDQGGPLHWLIWDRVSDHVGPMLFSIYIVWAIFLMMASRNPRKFASFLDFTIWANLAHGLTMIPQALGSHEYHSKFLTDIPWVVVLSCVLALFRSTYATATSTDELVQHTGP